MLVPQVLPAVTFTVPVPIPHVTSILVLPCPAVIVPFETVQLLVGCGDRAAMLNVVNPPLHHVVGNALITEGTDGLPFRVLLVLGTLVAGAHNTEFATTDTVPLVNEFDTFSRMVALPCPLAIVVPAGFVQVYVKPPGGFTTEY